MFGFLQTLFGQSSERVSVFFSEIACFDLIYGECEEFRREPVKEEYNFIGIKYLGRKDDTQFKF